jgi:hypothetical protein
VIKAYLLLNNIAMNFGTIKNIFASLVVESHLEENQKGKKLYKRFINLLKEDEVLKSQFIVYKNIEGGHFDSEVTASNYLKENIKVLKGFGEKRINESNKKLITLLKNNGISFKGVKVESLHKSIHTLITEKEKATNINKIHESFSDVTKWLLTDKNNKKSEDEYIRENIDPKKFLDIAIKKFNEKYSDLTEEEKNILKVLRENDEDSIRVLVGDLISENIELINQNLQDYSENLSIKEKLLETKDLVYKMKEDNNSFSENVLKLLELKSNLRNDS